MVICFSLSDNILSNHNRFMAVTRPIKYAKHKSNNRVMFTIAIVWIISVTIGSPIVLGLNTSPERTPELCIFYNSDFIIYSSLGSFYIPCVLMVILYYRIFKAIRERAKKPIGSSRGNHTTQQPTKGGRNRNAGVPREGTPSGDASQALVIENVHSKSSRSAIDRMRSPLPVISGSVAISSPDLEVHEEDEDEEESEAEDAVECKVIENVAAADLERRLHSHSLNRGRTNGNPDSGYVASHVEETQFCLRNPHTKDEATDEEEDFEMKDKFFDLEEGKVKNSKQNSEQNSKQTAETVGVVNSKEEEEEESPSLEERLGRASTSASPAAALANASTSSTSATEKEKEKKDLEDLEEKGRTGKGSSEEGKKKLRFHLRRKTKIKTTDPQKKREKASAKRERKATKTLAIVLGNRHSHFSILSLMLYTPFFPYSCKMCPCASSISLVITVCVLHLSFTYSPFFLVLIVLLVLYSVLVYCVVVDLSPFASLMCSAPVLSFPLSIASLLMFSCVGKVWRTL